MKEEISQLTIRQPSQEKVDEQDMDSFFQYPFRVILIFFYYMQANRFYHI